MLGLRLVVGNVVLSLQPGGGDALTRGLKEARRNINGGALIHSTYNSEVVKLNSERKQSTDSVANYASLFVYFVLVCSNFVCSVKDKQFYHA